MILGLSAGELRVRLLKLVVIALLGYHGKNGFLPYEVPLIDISHSAASALHLAKMIYITAGLESEVNLRVRDYAGRVPHAVSDGDILHQCSADRHRRCCRNCGLLARGKHLGSDRSGNGDFAKGFASHVFTLPRVLSQSSPSRSRRPTGSAGIHDWH